MFYSNVHTHSTWCDGKQTLREMAEAACQLHMTDLGFTSHSYAPFDPGCLGVKDEVGYQQAVAKLKEQYDGKLALQCGLEWDYFSPTPAKGYDYFIGSVHYFKPRAGVYASVDESPETFSKTLATWFDGDFLAMAEEYYTLVLRHVKENEPLIVGHFDLIKKFQNRLGYITQDNQAQYQDLTRQALAEVCQTLKGYGGLVEINTGGMSRGWTNEPYPGPFLWRELAQRKTPVIITSDSHEAKTLNFAFEETKDQLLQQGITETWQLYQGQFQPFLLTQTS